MRSLVLLNAEYHSSSVSPQTHLVATTVDPVSDKVFTLCQSNDAGGEISLEAYSRIGKQEPELLTAWSTVVLPDQATPTDEDPLVRSFKYLAEDDALVVVLSNGDIEQIFLNGGVGEATRENVGTFDEGIKAAEWSPDDELLAIVNGNDLLLTLTKAFDPLSEAPLHTDSFGTDAPVSVGWGAKSTQFHGSLGKTAAAQAVATDPLLTRERLLGPFDTGKVRIRWRGDASWFAVSSIEAVPPRPEQGAQERAIRRIRIFSRVGAELSSTTLPVASLEDGLDWIPTGELIASSQDISIERGEAGKKQIVFFERNGLRRYDFEVRETGRVREVGWNSASDVLAVWVEKEDGRHSVHLYHRSNYHWSLKQTLSPSLSDSPILFGFRWHPEQALELSLITKDGLEKLEFGWDTLRSDRDSEQHEDDATVAVVDGVSIHLTPFRLLNIPPPMSGTTLPSSATPVHMSFAPSSSAFPSSPTATAPLFFALLFPNSVSVYSWPLSLVGNAQTRARAGLPTPRLEWTAEIPKVGRSTVKQCAVLVTRKGEVTVGVARTVRDEDGELRDEIVIVGRSGEPQRVVAMEGARRIIAKAGKPEEEADTEGEEASFVLETHEGWLLEIPLYAQSEDLALPSPRLAPLPEFCAQVQYVLLPPVTSKMTSRFPVVLGLSSSGRLYSSSRLIAADATSFVTTPDFLIYTTFSHEAKFIPLFTLSPLYTGPTAIEHTESFARRAPGGGISDGGTQAPSLKRAVERGSRIVTVAPSSTSLVLQMPRGNLEIICPRPLVLRVVRDFIDARRFRAAFLLCRKHRIDLNLLVDHDPAFWTAHLAEFVDQVKEVDHLNLFLSGLKNEDVTKSMYENVLGIGSSTVPDTVVSATPDKINKVCNLVREELETRDVFHYANSILTAHVRKQPPAYEDALNLLAELKGKDAERAEDAVKYIIFLSDANRLFDLALGMYDFALVLMIAQHSQKDPREYLPFLRALRELPEALQRFKIDDHLARHESALRNLARAGPDHFDEVLEYTKKHGLFGVALEAYGMDEEKYKIVLEANAEDLFERSKYSESGLLFSLSDRPDKAILAYQHANAWQELFTVAYRSGKSDSDIRELAVESAERLTSKRRYAEAGKVLLEYAQDLPASVNALCEGNLFAEAVRLSSLHNRRDLVDSRINTSTLDMQQRLLDDFADITEQLEKQADRLDELRKRRENNPYQYFCIDDPSAALENLELAPDGVSDAGTAFTRYTTNPTTVASSQRSSSKTARSRRRAGLKKAAGKKGSVYEEMYLLNSIKKTYEIKLADLQADVAGLLPVLLTLSSSPHRTSAFELQSALTSFESFLESLAERIWGPREQEWQAELAQEQKIRDKGDAMLLAEWEARPKPMEGEVETRRVERPGLAKVKWRIGMLEGRQV